MTDPRLILRTFLLTEFYEVRRGRFASPWLDTGAGACETNGVSASLVGGALRPNPFTERPQARPRSGYSTTRRSPVWAKATRA